MADWQKELSMKKMNLNKWGGLLVVAALTFMAGASCTQNKKSNPVDEEEAATEEQEETSLDELENLAEALKKYRTVQPFSEGLAIVMDDDTELWGAIDKSGKEVIPCKFRIITNDFHEGVTFAYPAEEESPCVVIDKKGKVLFDIDFTYHCREFSDGLLAFCKPHGFEDYSDMPKVGDILSFGKLGFIDKKGNVVIQPDTYDVPMGEGPIISTFSEGLCKVWKDGHPIFIDTKGNEVINPKAGDVGNFSDGMASVFVYDDGTMGFINKRGEQVIPPSNRFEGATPFSEGRAFALKDGKYALIDKEGNELTPFLFDDISLYEGTEGEEPIIGMFHEGLAAVAKNGKFGYIDRDGNTVIPFRYKPGYDEDNEWYNKQAAYDFNEGVARVWSSRTKKYGFIDKEGNEITPCRFDEASDMSGGLALVQIGEDYGFIDKEGNCTLDLDE